MRVGIIGVGGVGMAHVIASVRNGYEIAFIVDSNEKTLNRAEKVWENRWSNVYEYADVQFGVVYSDRVPKNVSADMIIIATPPATHEKILEELADFKGRILLEKPVALSKSFYSLNIEVCTEWIHHSRVHTKKVLNNLEMHYTTEPKPWKKGMPLALDFCPHLFSVMIFHGYEIEDMEIINSTETEFDIDVLTSRGVVNLTGSRESDWGMGINGERYHWENDLFDKLQSVGGISLNNYELWELKLYSLLAD